MKKELALFFASLTAVFSLNVNAQAKEFVLGVVSSKPKSKIEQGKPFAEHMAQQIQQFGFDSASVQVFKTYDQLGHALKSGTVHLANATPFNAIYLEHHYDVSFIANRWKRGQEKYHSVFFTRSDNPIQSLKQLRGKRIAFEKSDSTSSYYLPFVTLLEQGETLQYLPTLDAMPDANKIGYILLDEHLEQSNEVNLSLWVYRQRIDASAFSNYNWENPKDLPEGLKKQLKIFARSADIPRDLLIASPSLSAEEKAVLKDTALSLHQNPENKEMLLNFQKTTQFGEINRELEDALDSIRDSAKLVDIH